VQCSDTLLEGMSLLETFFLVRRLYAADVTSLNYTNQMLRMLQIAESAKKMSSDLKLFLTHERRAKTRLTFIQCNYFFRPKRSQKNIHLAIKFTRKGKSTGY